MRIPTPDVTTGRAGKRVYLLVKRYDRTDVGGRWRRLHQEDYCQALGKPPSAKYESNETGVRGPTLKDMFEVTRRHMPASEIVRLLDMVVFNVLACNTDAHAKNYSIMIRASAPSVAPMYDVMCGVVWENVTKNLAQKIAGEGRGDHLKGSHWQRFARDCGLNPKQVIDRVGAMAKSLIAETRAAESDVAAMPAGGHSILAKRARRSRNGLALSLHNYRSWKLLRSPQATTTIVLDAPRKMPRSHPGAWACRPRQPMSVHERKAENICSQ